MREFMINKRYKDILEQYIHKGEPTPLTIGTLIVCVFCFLLLIIATFTQFNFSHPWIKYVENIGFTGYSKQIAYNPLFPTMIFIIYLVITEKNLIFTELLMFFYTKKKILLMTP